MAYSQTVSGEWYGIGTVSRKGSHNSYLSELLITQKGNRVTGVFNYFFRSDSIRTRVTGTFNSKTRELLLNAQPILNYKSLNQNGADCPMEGSFTLRVSRVESTLLGQFNPVYAYRFTCPAINIKFVKQMPGETINLTEQQPLIEEEIIEPPEEEKKVAVDSNVVKLTQRAFEASPVIEVDADSLKLSLYDNGEVDNDTISLFYNRKLVVDKKMLSDKPISFTLSLDTSVNEIAMYAENLGTIAPNTALCVVYAGEQRYELAMSSNFIKNATIRFRRKPRSSPPTQ
jgi:hypothetical protein